MQRLLKVILSDTSQLRLISCVAAFLMSVGFAFSVTNNPNYSLINDLATKYFWAVLFLVHAIQLGYSALNTIKYKHVLQLIALNGMMLWGIVFVSFLVADPTQIASTEWLLLLPFIVEVWCMANTLTFKTRT